MATRLKLDLKSIDIPTAAKQPLYAGVGATDLAVTAVREYTADVAQRVLTAQKDVTARVNGVSKSVSEFEPKKARNQAVGAVNARREAVESRVAEIQAEAKAFPGKVQSTIDDNVAVVTTTYSDLARRGEAVVKGTKTPTSVTVTVNTTQPTTGEKSARKTTGRKATSRSTTKAPTKADAKKAADQSKAAAKNAAGSTRTAAKKTANTAKSDADRTAATAKSSAKSTAGTAKTAAKKTATQARSTGKTAATGAKKTASSAATGAQKTASEATGTTSA